MPASSLNNTLFAEHERLRKEVERLLNQPISNERSAQMIDISNELRRLSLAIREESQKARELSKRCSVRNQQIVQSLAAKKAQTKIG